MIDIKYIYQKLISILNKVVMEICIIILFALVGILFMQVILRYYFHNPLSWPDEMARFLLIWITFLGAAIAFGYNGHLGINYFVNKFPKKIRNVVLFSIHIAIIFFLIIAFISSLKAVQISFRVSLTSLPLSWGHAFISFPVGTILGLLFYIDTIIRKRIE